MSNFADEHPLLMKTFELAVGTALSVASTAAVAFITGKIQGSAKKEPEKKDDGCFKVQPGDLETVIMIATDYAETYGGEWYKDANTVIDFQKDVNGQTALKLG